MAQEFARKFYDSTAWRRCRGAYIQYRMAVDGGMCETCHERPGYIVHHKKMLTASNINDPDVTLSYSNLKYDCLICHNKEEEHRKDGKKKLPDDLCEYVFTPDGDVTPVSPLK